MLSTSRDAVGRVMARAPSQCTVRAPAKEETAREPVTRVVSEGTRHKTSGQSTSDRADSEDISNGVAGEDTSDRPDDKGPSWRG